MKCLVIGASAGLGFYITRQLVGLGHEVFACSSDQRDLDTLKLSIELETNKNLSILSIDLANLDTLNLYENVKKSLGNIDALFLIAGFSDPHDTGQVNADIADKIRKINFESPTSIINQFLEDIKSTNGKIIIAGSVASIRPRGSNTLYGSCKTGLEFYGLGIQHYLKKQSKSTVTIYRLGYMKTNMTFGQKLLFPAADPKRIAAIIIKNLNRKSGVIYVPNWWNAISLAVNSIPQFIFNKLNI
jgi:short-subunit dehydrogenase